MKSFKPCKLAHSIALLSACVAPGAMSQEDDRSLVLEEIIVTAQIRGQSVQDVPSSFNVLSGTQLEDFTLQDFSQLEHLTPGLVTESIAARSDSIALRGID